MDQARLASRCAAAAAVLLRRPPCDVGGDGDDPAGIRSRRTVGGVHRPPAGGRRLASCDHRGRRHLRRGLPRDDVIRHPSTDGPAAAGRTEPRLRAGARRGAARLGGEPPPAGDAGQPAVGPRPRPCGSAATNGGEHAQVAPCLRGVLRARPRASGRGSLASGLRDRPRVDPNGRWASSCTRSPTRTSSVVSSFGRGTSTFGAGSCSSPRTCVSPSHATANPTQRHRP